VASVSQSLPAAGSVVVAAPAAFKPSLFRRPLLVVAAFCGVGLAALTAFTYANSFLVLDASIERAAQGINVGPLSALFDFYREIGGPFGLVAEGIVFAIVLLLNRHSWRLLVAGAVASGWYLLISHVVIRLRPTVPDVLRVTEHPSASSYPSGHTILFLFYATILMVCLGLKFIPRRWQPVGWAVAVLFVAVGGFSRVYSGAHWPTDVLAGALIGAGWLSLVLAIRWISDPVLERPFQQARELPDARAA
jgi:membrane-associated phospholipid phosphatase